MDLLASALLVVLALTGLSPVVCIQEYRLEVILRSYMNQRSQDIDGWCCDNEGWTPPHCNDRPCDPYFNISTVDFSNDVSTLQNTTPVYINKDALVFHKQIYVIKGSDALWQGGIGLNVTAMDYDEGTPHEKIVELLTEAIPLHTHSCMFQNKSEMEDLHFNGYVELNVSYRLTASNSSACVFTPCQSGETCQDLGWCEYYCELFDFCSRYSPCGNNGSCLNDRGSYSCSCSEGYSGTQCEQTDYCVVNSPCKNGGNCMVDGETNWYSCSCPVGWTGANCDVEQVTTMDHCVVNSPCKNGGNCTMDRIATAAGETNWYSCSCPVGWTGANCGVEQATAMVPSTNASTTTVTPMVVCEASTCAHHGYCVASDTGDGYQCVCKQHYSGEHCEHYEVQDSDSCSSKPSPLAISGIAAGSFVTGLFLSGVVCLVIGLCLKNQAKRKKYFQRVERNALYQSADDLDGCRRTSFDNGYVNPAALTQSQKRSAANKANSFSSSPRDLPTLCLSPQYETVHKQHIHNRPHNLRLSGRALPNPQPGFAGKQADYQNCRQTTITEKTVKCRDENFAATEKDPHYNDAHLYESLDMSRKATPVQGAFSLPLHETHLAKEMLELYTEEGYTVTEPDVQGSMESGERQRKSESLSTVEEEEEEEEEDGKTPLGPPSEPTYSEVKRPK